LSSVLILVSAAAFVLNALFKGSPQVAHEICLSLRYKEISKNDFCNGAIAALGWSFDYTLQTVRSSYPLYLWYAPLIFLATIVFLSLKMLRRIRAFMILNTFSFFPLFVVVNDYGRWISMIVITNILILFAFEKEFPLKWRWRANGNDPKFGVTSCVYVLFWGIPHYAEPRYGFPIVNPILSIGKFLQHILNLF
jgi:hypothetical protein